MSDRYYPSLITTLWKRVPTIGLAWAIGIGVNGCSGGGEPDEAVQAEGENNDSTDKEETSEASPETTEGQAAPAESELAGEPDGDGDEGADTPVAEAESPPGGGDPSAPAPSGDVDVKTDTVNAELASDKAPIAEDLASTPPPAANAPASTAYAPSVVASPGAVMNLEKNGVMAYSSADSQTNASVKNDADGHYIVVAGDTLAVITHRIYGHHKQWQAVAERNGINAPYVIYPGDVLRYEIDSPKSKSFASNYHKSKKHVTVKRGDTLIKIAEELYGNPFSWKVLYGLNKDKINNPHRIAVGMKLAYVAAGANGKAHTAKTKAKSKAAVAAKKAPAAKPAPVEEPAASPTTEDGGADNFDTVPASANASGDDVEDVGADDGTVEGEDPAE